MAIGFLLCGRVVWSFCAAMSRLLWNSWWQIPCANCSVNLLSLRTKILLYNQPLIFFYQTLIIVIVSCHKGSNISAPHLKINNYSVRVLQLSHQSLTSTAKLMHALRARNATAACHWCTSVIKNHAEQKPNDYSSARGPFVYYSY